ncbi:MAG: nickel pincer cofactor biosynthesis protein LarB [Candidatus Fermentibacteraceae bacterium]|nr:nickel pincer cofactor biosynthesis protein LarB [Candidatus Fermentibacteraceae bacterium]
MDIEHLLKILNAAGIKPGEAVSTLRSAGLDDLGFSVVDSRRGERQPLPEVVFGEGKTVEQVVAIAQTLFKRTGLAIVSRVPEGFELRLNEVFPTGKMDDLSRMFVAGEYTGSFKTAGSVVVVTAGTSDLPVAEEAVIVLETMGVSVKLLADVGVAGIHRLSNVLPDILSASVCIACAGMDAALVSVLGGLFPGPVIALPVSTGYGVALDGFTALFSSLSSCSPGVSVVNIDNGVGAAAVALRILKQITDE